MTQEMTQEEATQDATMQSTADMNREILTIRHECAATLAQLRTAQADLQAIMPAYNAATPAGIARHNLLQSEIARLTELARVLDEQELAKVKEVAEIYGRAGRVDAIAREFNLSPGMAAQVKGDTLAEMRTNARKLGAVMVQPSRDTASYKFNQGVDGVPFPD